MAEPTQKPAGNFGEGFLDVAEAGPSLDTIASLYALMKGAADQPERGSFNNIGEVMVEGDSEVSSLCVRIHLVPQTDPSGRMIHAGSLDVRTLTAEGPKTRGLELWWGVRNDDAELREADMPPGWGGVTQEETDRYVRYLTPTHEQRVRKLLGQIGPLAGTLLKLRSYEDMDLSPMAIDIAGRTLVGGFYTLFGKAGMSIVRREPDGGIVIDEHTNNRPNDAGQTDEGCEQQCRTIVMGPADVTVTERGQTRVLEYETPEFIDGLGLVLCGLLTASRFGPGMDIYQADKNDFARALDWFGRHNHDQVARAALDEAAVFHQR